MKLRRCSRKYVSVFRDDGGININDNDFDNNVVVVVFVHDNGDGDDDDDNPSSHKNHQFFIRPLLLLKAKASSHL